MEVLSDQAFPCDLLLLHSRTENNQCYITTANLDGETNLKVGFIFLILIAYDIFFSLNIEILRFVRCPQIFRR